MPQTLQRQLGLFPAVMLGLGSILGTGIFVSIGVAAGVAGPAVVLAIAIAAVVATCNALSSAQLAAAHPVSGGTYEYGYRFLNAPLGFLAGWMFLLAKSASAATAALGFAGYALASLGMDSGWRIPLAVATVLIFTGIVLAGIRRSTQANAIIVVMTLLSLALFCAAGIMHQLRFGAADNFQPFLANADKPVGIPALLQATALMFVAYTGYGRIATMAEEVTDPRRTIPRAIIATLSVSAVLYILVAVAGIGAVGAPFLADATSGAAAPLQRAAQAIEQPAVAWIIAVGAATAMLGVLLNLILGLSRVLLAMGRRRDMPAIVARLDGSATNPWVAVLVIGLLIAGLAAIGSVKTTWSFSAFTVLIYYAITNAAALALPTEYRLYPRWVAAAGLFACVGLAFWVDASVWIAGLVLGVVGLAWWAAAHGVRRAAA